MTRETPDGPPVDHPAEAELFHGALVCDLVLPARFEAGEHPLMLTRSEALLHGLAVAEDMRSDAADDERGNVELPHAVQRVEAKLDLILNLLSRLARDRQGALVPCPVRWSHRGIRLDLPAAPPPAPADQAGILSLQPADWLSDHIELPVRVLAEQAGTGGLHHLWLVFGTLTAGLEDALERHLFRLHRRQIAEARLAANNK